MVSCDNFTQCVRDIEIIMSEIKKGNDIHSNLNDMEILIDLMKTENVYESNQFIKKDNALMIRKYQNEWLNYRSVNKNLPPSHLDQISRLENARAQLIQTEEVASNTLVVLKQQREGIERIRFNVRSVVDDIKKSKNIISKLGQWWRG